MGEISGTRSTFGKMAGPPAIIDLVANSAAPSEIDSSGHMVAQVALYCSASFHWTIAPDQTLADTRIAADATRGFLPAGFYGFPVSGSSNKLYIRSNTATGTTDGVSYVLIEED